MVQLGQGGNAHKIGFIIDWLYFLKLMTKGCYDLVTSRQMEGMEQFVGVFEFEQIKAKIEAKFRFDPLTEIHFGANVEQKVLDSATLDIWSSAILPGGRLDWRFIDATTAWVEAVQWASEEQGPDRYVLLFDALAKNLDFAPYRYMASSDVVVIQGRNLKGNKIGGSGTSYHDWMKSQERPEIISASALAMMMIHEIPLTSLRTMYFGTREVDEGLGLAADKLRGEERYRGLLRTIGEWRENDRPLFERGTPRHVTLLENIGTDFRM